MTLQTTQTPPSELQYTTHQLFDTTQYPIDQPESKGFQDLLKLARHGLDGVNCAKLDDFIRPEIVAKMQEEATGLSDQAVFHSANLNPYFSEAPAETPEDHPLKRFSPRRHGMVRADLFPRDGVIWAIFQNQDLCRFVAHALGYEHLYTYRDPYGSVNVNVQPDGCEFAWHFDNNEFTVSLGLKQSAQGGEFEYVPNLRSVDDENYDQVRAVLDGKRDDLRSLVLRPGDLQLFKGGYTLHRVTAPKGKERQSLLLSYVSDPHDITTSDKAIRIWGEAAPEHYARDKRTA
ncbi:HalD/BesD family halogenase [Cochlodiniinecator piscidefendens]|uniref:HalD/BesD family halogenase n=1 Tax=Cochlodiniinecator piscidefendens TaxID=2715756 RepID=UPI00140C79C6|nr:hypothetical protein [Cochlodiniinecator piscidefendens]